MPIHNGIEVVSQNESFGFRELRHHSDIFDPLTIEKKKICTNVFIEDIPKIRRNFEVDFKLQDGANKDVQSLAYQFTIDGRLVNCRNYEVKGSVAAHDHHVLSFEDVYSGQDSENRVSLSLAKVSSGILFLSNPFIVLIINEH